MRISASIGIMLRVEVDVPAGTSDADIQTRLFEEARFLAENNGVEHVVLEASVPGLAESAEVLGGLGFPVVVEHVPIEAEPDHDEYQPSSRYAGPCYDDGDW